jgi:hypothetical protein
MGQYQRHRQQSWKSLLRAQNTYQSDHSIILSIS